jgi:hypothetical protein
MRHTFALGLTFVTVGMTACSSNPASPGAPLGFQTQDAFSGYNVPAGFTQYDMGVTGTQTQNQYTGGNSAALAAFGPTLGAMGSGYGGLGMMPGASPMGGMTGFGVSPLGSMTGMGGLGTIGMPSGLGLSPMGSMMGF